MTNPLSIEYLEKRLMDQREETSNQLVVIHASMRDDKKDFFDALAIVSKNVERIAINLEKLQTEQSIRLDHHGERLGKAEMRIDLNNESRIKTGAYWGIAGVIATAILGACVKLLFFPSPPL